MVYIMNTLNVEWIAKTAKTTFSAYVMQPLNSESAVTLEDQCLL